MMAHSCPTCGQACYCDLEDHDNGDVDDCVHDCDPADLHEDEED
jgi:hypothetical protein